MKLLLVILGAIIAVNVAAVEPNDSLPETSIKRIGEEMLKQLKSIQEGVQQIQEDTKHAISLKLKKIPEVKEVEDLYIAGLTDRSLDVECAVSIDKHYLETLDIISADILKKTLKNVTGDEDKLNTIQKDLGKIQTTLEENLDQEVQKCVKDSNNCSITGDYIESTNELFKFVDLVKYKIVSHAENEVSSDDVKEKVKEYVANVPKCLTEKNSASRGSDQDQLCI